MPSPEGFQSGSAESTAAGEFVPRRHSRRGRTPLAYRICDGLTEAVLYLMTVFTPWAFGTTERWSIWVMNIGGFTLGALLITKWLIRWRSGFQPARWGRESLGAPASLPARAPDSQGVASAYATEAGRDAGAPSGLPNREPEATEREPGTGDPEPRTAKSQRYSRWLMRALAVLTVLTLAYCLVSAINARVIYHPEDHSQEFRDNAILWLPHSYDRAGTWFAFWEYLGLAFSFWAARDWLLGKTRRERHRDLVPHQAPHPTPLPEREGVPPNLPLPKGEGWGEAKFRVEGVRHGESALPDRVKRLLWILCLNGALLGLVCILQRLDGTDKLLWFRERSYGRWIAWSFGPYPYRSNAAQYFNLLWPVCIGFWWVLSTEFQVFQRFARRAGSGAHIVLLPLAILMGACPTISTSRGGALISFVALPLVFGLVAAAGRPRRKKGKLMLAGLFLCLIGFGLYMGWEPLEKRLLGLKEFSKDVSSQERLEQYANTWNMVQEYPVFGVGPGAYEAVYQFYRIGDQKWYPFAHNDWLQILTEWGSVGGFLTLCLLLLAAGIALTNKTGYAVLCGTTIIGLSSILVHASFDFPLQIHSILFSFLLLLSLAGSLPTSAEVRRRANYWALTSPAESRPPTGR